jgi:tetratricopeptide (TPR) repeat protein
VFAGGTTLVGAAAILGPGTDEFEAIELLTRLVNKSLVIAEVAVGSNARYRMLETVRQYGRERLIEAEEANSTCGAHLRFYVAFTETAAANLPTANQAEWLELLDRDRENILAAHRWCDHDAAGAELGLRLTGAVRLYWLNRGKFEFGLQVTREAIARDRARTPSPERVLALYGEGSLAYALGDYAGASASLAESVALARSLGDRVGVSRALHMLGAVATAQKNNAAARIHLEEVIAIARETGDMRRLSAGLGSLAECHRVDGRLEDAAPLYEEALVLARESGNVDSEAVCLLNCAALDILRGRPDDSRSRAAKAVEIVQEIRSMRLGQASLDLASGLAAACGEWVASARFYGASQAVLQRTGARREPVDEEFLAPLLGKARRSMGEKSFAAAETEGIGIPYDEAMAETRAWLARRQSTR